MDAALDHGLDGRVGVQLDPVARFRLADGGLELEPDDLLATAIRETEEEVGLLRNEAKTFAREWVDMARSSRRDPQDAFDLCITMASAQACGLQTQD